MSVRSKKVRKPSGVRWQCHARAGLTQLSAAACIVALSALGPLCGVADEPAGAAREISARAIPTPTTVSPELQRVIAQPWTGGDWSDPQNADQWKANIRERNQMIEKLLPDLKKKLHVSVKQGSMAGVRVYHVKPETVAQQNRGRLLVHLHGGAYVYLGGEAATFEAILMAGHGRFETLVVDYRMPPDDPFPAALDDAVAVWKEVLKSRDPKTVGLFGTSAGGGLTLAAVLKLKQLKLPLPGALMAGTPWSDLSKTGDTYYTNEFVDNILGTADGRLLAAARLYAGARDLKEPLLSPIYGDFSEFPPTILLSGTRDLFLSNTVRTHQKLRAAGVAADLFVYEGQSHAQYLIATDAPESAAAYREVGRFFERHLGK